MTKCPIVKCECVIIDLTRTCPARVLSRKVRWAVADNGLMAATVKFPVVFAVAYFNEFARLGFYNENLQRFQEIAVSSVLGWISERLMATKSLCSASESEETSTPET